MTTLLQISGMSCSSCASQVKGELQKVPGVGAVAVDLEGGRATVEHDAAVEGERLITAVESGGYRGEIIPPDAEVLSPLVPPTQK